MKTAGTTAKIFKIKATIMICVKTVLFLKVSPISHPSFNSLVSSNNFNLGLRSIISPSQTFSNSFIVICCGFGFEIPGSKQIIDFSFFSVTTSLKEIMYLPFFNLKICCLFFKSLVNSV